MSPPSAEQVTQALAAVKDPEIRRPITDLGMVESTSAPTGRCRRRVLLTIAACPMRDTLTQDVTAAVARCPASTSVCVSSA